MSRVSNCGLALSKVALGLSILVSAGAFSSIVVSPVLAKPNNSPSPSPSPAPSPSPSPSPTPTSSLGFNFVDSDGDGFSDTISGIDIADIGQSFTINFDGSVSTQNVTGLTSTAVFTLTGFTTNTTATTAVFSISLDNTSTNGIDSRTSAIGFNTSADLVGASSSGLFDNAVLNGSFPNQFGNVDLCLTDGNTCQGGQSGGVYTADAPEIAIATLTFDDSVTSISLNNFGVRYQSIDGTNLGTSGTGEGTVGNTPSPTPTPVRVPEPSGAVPLLLMGAAVLSYGKKRKLRESTQE